MSKNLVFGTNTELLGSYSEMLGASSFVIRTRRTLNRRKLLIDVTEITTEAFMLPAWTRMQARAAARHYGASGIDFTEILGNLISEIKIASADGSQTLVKIRRNCMVFSAVV